MTSKSIDHFFSYTLVQYCLNHFLSESSEDDSVWLKCFKACLREKFHLYFNEKINQCQRNINLVSSDSITSDH